MNWINVNEKLPIENVDVIVCTKNGEIYCCHLFGKNLRTGKNIWCFPFVGWGSFIENVTYWMPLPNPPEENKSKFCDDNTRPKPSHTIQESEKALANTKEQLRKKIEDNSHFA